MDQFTKDGRKLRPRKTSTTSRPSYEKVEFSRSDDGARTRTDSYEHSYPQRRSSSNYGERRPYGERRSYSDSRPHSEGRRPYGESRYSDSRSSYADTRSNYGESRYSESRSNYGESRGNYGERRSYPESRGNYPESRGNYPESRSNYGEGRPSRPHSEPRGNYGESRYPESNYDRRPSPKPAARKAAPARKKKFPPKDSSKIFSKEASEGINNMISRRPIVNGKESSDKFEFPIKDEIRLNKFIANSGVCSRREADTLIQAGVVTVNGEVVTELGTKVNIHNDDIRFNGERLKGEEKVYIIMNKPRGFVTTSGDPHADKTVLDLIKSCNSRVYPVGRLDKNTTGVLMLTNDGEIAERLTHPSYDKKKIYQVALDRELSEEDFQKILNGVELSDGIEKADELEYIDQKDKRKLGIEIHSGKNRVVRRLFECIGYNVKALDRVYFAGLTKKSLKKGEWRYLTEGEINILRMGAYI